jgi:hypothetical protein
VHAVSNDATLGLGNRLERQKLVTGSPLYRLIPFN